MTVALSQTCENMCRGGMLPIQGNKQEGNKYLALVDMVCSSFIGHVLRACDKNTNPGKTKTHQIKTLKNKTKLTPKKVI